MTPAVFCPMIQRELASVGSDQAWVRGALAACDMYAATDASRFELIVTQLAHGPTGSAVADGARWLLPRWQSVVDAKR